MAGLQWGDKSQVPDWGWGIPPGEDTGGGNSPGYEIAYNPKTGRFEPTSSATTVNGRREVNPNPPQGGGTGGGGGLGGGLGNGGGATPASTTAATPAAEPWGSTAGTLTGSGATPAAPWYATLASKVGGASAGTWGNILNAALAMYGMGREGQTPNTYPVPLTKTEQETADAKKGLFNYHSAFTDQYLRGMSDLNPNFKLNTNAVGNPDFMGGVKVPTFDFSKMQRPTMGDAVNNTNPQAGAAGGDAAIWAEIHNYGPQATMMATQLSNSGVPLPTVLATVKNKFAGGTP